MKLKSGREFDPNAGIIGLAEENEPVIYGGYDDTFGVWAVGSKTYRDPKYLLSREDVDEIADVMMVRWIIFKQNYGTAAHLS